jgi:hypothetical protein
MQADGRLSTLLKLLGFTTLLVFPCHELIAPHGTSEARDSRSGCVGQTWETQFSMVSLA